MSDRRTEIRNAYKQTGGHASFYDGMMTYSTFLGKAICRVVWNMDGEMNYTYLERALSGVPEGFAGKLLEVPVGTGVLTMPVYRALPGADITCLDYSPDMMSAAKARAEHMDKAYHQKWFHARGMLFPGIVFALIPAALVGWLVTLIR